MECFDGYALLKKDIFSYQNTNILGKENKNTTGKEHIVFCVVLYAQNSL